MIKDLLITQNKLRLTQKSRNNDLFESAFLIYPSSFPLKHYEWFYTLAVNVINFAIASTASL